MKTKYTGSKFVLFLSFFFLQNLIVAQTVQIIGVQVRGTMNNATLESQPVAIDKDAEITFIEGENDGFWIVDANGNTIECFFPSADRKNYDPQPLKFLLRQGVYKVFPNLKENQRKATVKISLKYI